MCRANAIKLPTKPAQNALAGSFATCSGGEAILSCPVGGALIMIVNKDVFASYYGLQQLRRVTSQRVSDILNITIAKIRAEIAGKPYRDINLAGERARYEIRKRNYYAAKHSD